MTRLIAIAAGALLGASGTAVAADFDGSRALLCASLRGVECGAFEECYEGPADGFNVPHFFHIDFIDQAVRAKRPDGSELNTIIRTSVLDSGLLVLQGVEAGRGWSASISQTTGRIVITASDEEVALAVFGACTPAP